MTIEGLACSMLLLPGDGGVKGEGDILGIAFALGRGCGLGELGIMGTGVDEGTVLGVGRHQPRSFPPLGSATSQMLEPTGGFSAPQIPAPS